MKTSLQNWKHGRENDFLRLGLVEIGLRIGFEMVSVAQLVRAPDCGSGGWGFKSPHSPSVSIGSLAMYRDNFPHSPLHYLSAPVAQLDRAPGFEPVGCVFESRRARCKTVRSAVCRVQKESSNHYALCTLHSSLIFCPASSTWQSNGFLIRGLEVRILCGVFNFN